MYDIRYTFIELIAKHKNQFPSKIISNDILHVHTKNNYVLIQVYF